MEIFDNLNPQQKIAVTQTEGAVLVLAGAGSGKTRVLTHRIAYLLKELEVSPYNILAITFTNKATNEMRERLEKLTGYSGMGLWVSTFHSFCCRILRYHIEEMGNYTKSFTIYGDLEKERTIKRILGNMDLKKDLAGKMSWHISYAKTAALTPSQYEFECQDGDPSTVIEVYRAYERELENSNALDYDDLLLKTKQLFETCPAVLQTYQERFRYIHVDEYQDTNHIQYEIVKMLAGVHGNFFAVGDEDQSIYGWRGASIQNILNFRKDFPEAKIYKLEQNYRSTTSILDAANHLIKNNHNRIDKTLWSDLGQGEKITFYTASSDRDEADFVVRKIHDLIDWQGYSPRDIAILVRINAITNCFEERLRMYNLPYKVFGGVKFFDRKEVKDFLAYLRILANPRDNEAMLRVINTPKRGIGDTVVSALVDYCSSTGKSVADVIFGNDLDAFTPATARKLSSYRDVLSDLMFGTTGMSLGEAAEYVLHRVNFDTMYDRSTDEGLNRLLNIEDVLQSIKEFEENNPSAVLSEYLESISLISDSDEVATDDFISLATIHAVKGLEFRAVFVVGLEEGIFPNAYNKSDAELEEERRVMYVAVTRAMEKLYLTNASSRYRFATFERNMESRFLTEIKESLGLVRNNLSAGFWDRYQKPANTIPVNQKPMVSKTPEVMPYSYSQKPKVSKGIKVSIGEKVSHAKFGIGVVIAIDGDNASIAFDKLGIKKLNLTIAPLTKVE